MPWKCLGLFCIIFLVQGLPVHAGDEEFNPSAYQIFDPVTGYYIDVEPAPDEQITTTSGHTGTADGQGVQEPALAAASTQAQQTADTLPEAESNTGRLILTTGLVLLVLAGVFVFVKRKGEHG